MVGKSLTLLVFASLLLMSTGSKSTLSISRWINLLRYVDKSMTREPVVNHTDHVQYAEHVELVSKSIKNHFFNDILEGKWVRRVCETITEWVADSEQTHTRSVLTIVSGLVRVPSHGHALYEGRHNEQIIRLDNLCLKIYQIIIVLHCWRICTSLIRYQLTGVYWEKYVTVGQQPSANQDDTGRMLRETRSNE